MSKLLLGLMVSVSVLTSCKCLSQPFVGANEKAVVESDGTYLTVGEKYAQDVSTPLTVITGNPMVGMLVVAAARALFSGK